MAEFSLHESPATQLKYRKEAERLMLWAIVERSCALSSLAQEDAVAYRAFLHRPTPRPRWVGPPRPRSSRAGSFGEFRMGGKEPPVSD